MACTSGNEEIYAYHIVEFISRGKKPKVRKTDIVATKWIVFNLKKKKPMVKYPPPPYDTDLSLEYDEMLKNLSDAPISWKDFTIEIKGRAKNLDEAHRKLEELKTKDTALTMESGDSCTEIEKKVVTDLRQNMLVHQAEVYKEAVTKKSLDVRSPEPTVNAGRCKLRIKEIKNLPAESQLPLTIKKFHSKGDQQNLNNDSRQGSNILPQDKVAHSEVPVVSENASTSNDFLKAIMSDDEDTLVNPVPIENNYNAKTAHDEFQNQISENDKNLLTAGISSLQEKKNTIIQSSSDKLLQFQETMTRYWLDMMNQLKIMQDDLNEMKSDIQFVKAMQLKNNNNNDFVGSTKQISEKFNYNIPFTSIEDFQRFDAELKINESLKEAVCLVLETGNDSTMVVSRSIVNMLKMFLDKSVATQYVAIKSVDKKHVMKNTNFFNCIETSIKQRRKLCNLPTTDKEIKASLSTVLCNAGSWYTTKKNKNIDVNSQASTSREMAINNTSSSTDKIKIATCIDKKKTVPLGDDEISALLDNTPILSYEEYLKMKNQSYIDSSDNDSSDDHYLP